MRPALFDSFACGIPVETVEDECLSALSRCRGVDQRIERDPAAAEVCGAVITKAADRARGGREPIGPASLDRRRAKFLSTTKGIP